MAVANHHDDVEHMTRLARLLEELYLEREKQRRMQSEIDRLTVENANLRGMCERLERRFGDESDEYINLVKEHEDLDKEYHTMHSTSEFWELCRSAKIQLLRTQIAIKISVIRQIKFDRRTTRI